MRKAGMDFTFENIVQLFTALSCIFLVFFLTLLSIFNQDIKVLMYMAGVCLSLFISYGFTNIFKLEPLSERGLICDIMKFPLASDAFSEPSLNSVFIGFTMMYLLLPMIENGIPNYPLIVSLFSLFGLDAYHRYSYKCNRIFGIVFGMLIGLVSGAAWYLLLRMNDLSGFLYFGEVMSNNVMCSAQQHALYVLKRTAATFKK